MASRISAVKTEPKFIDLKLSPAKARVLGVRVSTLNYSARLMGVQEIQLRETDDPIISVEIDHEGGVHETVVQPLELEFRPIQWDDYLAIGAKTAISVSAFLGEDPSPLFQRPPVCDHCGDDLVHDLVYVFRRGDESDCQIARDCLVQAFPHIQVAHNQVLEHAARVGLLLDGMVDDDEEDPSLVWRVRSKKKVEDPSRNLHPHVVTAIVAASVIAGLGLGVGWRAADPNEPVTQQQQQARAGGAQRPTGVKLDWSSSGGGGPGSGRRLTALESAQIELWELLKGLRAAESSDERQELHNRLETRMQQLLPALLGLLADANHPMILDAIRVVKTYKVSDALPMLAHLAQSSRVPVRAAATEAGASLSDWWQDKAAPLVTTRVDGIGSDAFSITTAESNPDTLLEALKLKPGLATEADVLALCHFVRSATRGIQKLQGIRALARLQPTAVADLCIAEQLNSHDSAVRRAALDALANLPFAPNANHQQQKRVIDELLRIVTNPGTRSREVAMALLVIERRGHIPVDQLKEYVDRMAPALQVLVARCLVTGGEREGAQLATSLLAQDLSGNTYAGREAVALLEDLSGLHHGTDVEAWNAWIDRQDIFRPSQLARPPAPSW